VLLCIFLYPSLSCDESQTGTAFCTLVDLFVPCLKADFISPRNCSTQTQSITVFRFSKEFKYGFVLAVNEPCDRNGASGNLFM
jgi:hypothetical protein